ncbi:type VI secretion system tube protein TssD [Fibrella aquatilis]|uniref:Uncharacterized protein n=1 Tax=Fibrella aquatilis TaxID=2817059 RepID=A0A939G8S3_9BACT|nr:type VI secretion system tube protein TssD [Fibrella aquatilis]MBO0933313.1 hypothetical protein [Fibrella aquatilis]
MASFRGILKVGAFTTDVNFFHLSIFQSMDSLGRPASSTRGGSITVEFNSTSDGVVAEWMINPSLRMDGSVTFLDINSKSTLRTITFSNAYCVSLSEHADNSGGGNQMTTTIVISPEVVNAGSVKLDKKWPLTE